MPGVPPRARTATPERVERAGAGRDAKFLQCYFHGVKRNYISFILAMGQRRSFTGLFRGFSRQGAARAAGWAPARWTRARRSLRRFDPRPSPAPALPDLSPRLDLDARAGRWKRARRVPCPACAGTGYI